MKINKAIILSAGFGKRLNPLTLIKPKPLLEIKGKSLLENTIDILEKYGINDVRINSHYLSDQIKNFLDKKKFNCSINLIEEKKNILNTGGGIYNISSAPIMTEEIMYPEVDNKKCENNNLNIVFNKFGILGFNNSH